MINNEGDYGIRVKYDKESHIKCMLFGKMFDLFLIEKKNFIQIGGGRCFLGGIITILPILLRVGVRFSMEKQNDIMCQRNKWKIITRYLLYLQATGSVLLPTWSDPSIEISQAAVSRVIMGGEGNPIDEISEYYYSSIFKRKNISGAVRYGPLTS